jgi:hypothetical protein
MADRGTFDLGALVGPDGVAGPERLTVGSADLTTHAVIVGMTGSGKTGLAIDLVEETLLAGIPVLVLDPKGDLGNLALVFPDLSPASFRPWVPEAEAHAAGLTLDAYAEKIANDWRTGLAASGIGPERLQALRDAADVIVYTPGSTTGVPLDVIGSLRPPALSWESEAEALRDEIEGTVTSLLALVGISSDPLSSREHVLLSNLVEHAWRAGRELDLATLIAEIQTPPFRKLGVFELDRFFPAKDRTALALRLNALVASPQFAAWGAGQPLDPQSLLFTESGGPRCAVVYLAHLSESERQLVVTLVLSRLVTWMRAQSGTPDLRALVYMDEVFGFVPPTAEPPPKKPILTIAKQGRAFGVGLVLSTQNPVDLDYKAMANAGTWLVGRLQTENDKARVLEGLRSATGSADVSPLGRAIGALRKREFLLVSAKASEPRLFSTRWAMSYLRGPLTRDEVARLRPAGGDTDAEASPRAGRAAAPAPAPPTPPPDDDALPTAPAVAPGIAVCHVDPAAPWAAEVGVVPGSTRLHAALALRCSVRFDEARGGLDVLEEWEAILPLEGGLDLGRLVQVDYDDRDLAGTEPPGAAYVVPDAPLADASLYRMAGDAVRRHLVASQAMEVHRNAALKLWSRPGESLEAFAERCAAEADVRADAEVAKLGERVATKRKRLQDALLAVEQRAAEASEEASARKQSELLAGAGQLVGALLKGHSTSRGLGTLGRSLGGGASARARARERSAVEKAARTRDDLAELEQQLADDVVEITERWATVAADLETVAIGVEAADVRVVDIRLVWLPGT